MGSPVGGSARRLRMRTLSRSAKSRRNRIASISSPAVWNRQQTLEFPEAGVSTAGGDGAEGEASDHALAGVMKSPPKIRMIAIRDDEKLGFKGVGVGPMSSWAFHREIPGGIRTRTPVGHFRAVPRVDLGMVRRA